MTSSTSKRLDKLESALTPQAAFLVWWAEVQQYPTMPAYATALKDAPESAYPLALLPHRVEEAVRAAHKGEKPEIVWPLVRQAVQDVVFLYYVHSQCNTQLMEDWRAYCLQIALGASHLARLFEHEIPRRDEASLARTIARTALTELLEWEGAVQVLADRYFGGQSPLYPALAAQLAGLVHEAETMATLYNEHLDWLVFLAEKPAPTKGKVGRKKGASTGPIPAEPIDLDALRTTTQAGGTELARHIVAMAQAEMYSFMGEPRKGLALMKRRLWPEGS
jgi:hypothetical protein